MRGEDYLLPTAPHVKHDRAAMRFEDFARLPDERMDVVLGAALIAKELDAEVDVPGTVAAVRALGEPLAARKRDLAAMPMRTRCQQVSAFFCKKLGFKGNVENYDDPKNSFLDQVLARRTGIPITLSILWCEVARHAGLDARGVAFPGHFMVRVDDEDGEPIMLDPFGEGRFVDDATATKILQQAAQGRLRLERSWFAPASPRAILFRMFSNLHAHYSTHEPARAFVCVDRKLMLVPDSKEALQERASLAMRIGALDVARADIDRLIELDPNDDRVPFLRARLGKLSASTPPEKPTLH
jgi:regulator of sirC expression with transglutaminase-like and TPR domain